MSASVLNPTKRADMSADMSADTFGSKHADLADMSGNTLLKVCQEEDGRFQCCLV